MTHKDGHEHDHHHGDKPELSQMQLRTRALESILTEKGLIDTAALDLLVETYETKIGPRRGAKVVARSWTDPEFAALLFENATTAVERLGFGGQNANHLIALRNTPSVHNLVVCTLCSCYPWSILGLPPLWYKSAPYRSQAVQNPRRVLREFHLELPDDCEVRVWDSTAEVRFLVVPMRPPGTESFSEEALAELVTRDSMIGTALARMPGDRR